MKNLLYIAAIAATAVGFTSCSSNEDLNDAVKDSGVPFKVTASAPTTRATDLTSSNFTNFQLYAFEGTNEWISGARFTKNTSWAPFNANETYNWPHAGVASKFYAISENGTEMSSAFAVNDIANTQSFTYTVPTTVADQKDLLIASAEGMSTDAKVSLEFKHALAAAKLQFTITPTYTAYDKNTYPTYRLRAEIKSITFNNVYTTGTYNFTNNSWGNQSTNGAYKIEFTTPIVVDTKISESKTVTVDLSTIGSLMFIPQKIDKYWDIAPGKQTIGTEPTDEAYISAEAQTMIYDATSGSGSVISALDYERTSTALNPQNPLGIAKVEGQSDPEKNGYFKGETKIATLEGEIKDVSATSIFNEENLITNGYLGEDALTVIWITYANRTEGQSDPDAYYSDHDLAGYGKMLKPLSLASYSAAKETGLVITYSPLTLSNLKNHNLNIELGACVNSKNGQGIFGTLAIGGGSAKRN